MEELPAPVGAVLDKADDEDKEEKNDEAAEKLIDKATK
jgi:hypothetical protein